MSELAGGGVPARVLDPDRLAAVRASAMLDTAAEPEFDDLARLAARLTGMPLAYITFVDETRSYWKATIGTGIAPDDTRTRQNTVQESFCQYVIAADGPVVVADASTDARTRDNPWLESMDVRAWAGYPVRNPAGHVLGSFCVVDTSPRTFSDDDLEVLSTLAVAASREIALRAAVQEATVLARQAAELAAETDRASRRLGQQAAASEVLGASLQARDVLRALGSLVLPELGRLLVVALPGSVAAPVFGLSASDDPTRVLAVEVAHVEPDRAARLRELLTRHPYTTSDDTGVGRVVATGQPYAMPDLAGIDLTRTGVRAEVAAELFRVAGVSSALTVPLTSRGRVLGAMTVAGEGAPLDAELIADLGRRAGIALDNAISYDREHRIGLDLQRSLVPGPPAVQDGIVIASRYLPAAIGALAGGDFHQVLRREDDLVLVLGDVEGHGMTSAAQMGQLRAAVAALALEGHQPGPLLERLATGAPQILRLNFATLVVAALDPATRSLAIASAGHPPPVIRPPGGPAYVPDLKPAPPIGGPARPVNQVSLEFPAGSLLVLYTDGLIERRREDLGDGIERLRAAVDTAATRGVGVEHVADDLLAAFDAADGSTDDIALLIVT